MLSRGDTLVVWKLDRLGRGMCHLVVLVEELRDRGINFRSLTDSIDTSTPMGRWQKWNVSLSLNVHALDLMQLAQKVV